MFDRGVGSTDGDDGCIGTDMGVIGGAAGGAGDI